MSNKQKQQPLAQWLKGSYLRSAIIPLLLIEIVFLTIYWVSSNFTYTRNADTVKTVSQNYLSDIANREAMTIQATLGSVEGLTSLYALETSHALATPFDPPAAEKARYRKDADGVFYTVTGGDQTASFYSGYVPVGPDQIDKVWRTARLDQTMRNIKQASPLVRQVYLNTWDSYNRIYPYFNVRTQYAPKMNIPTYNFFYEADARHNPERKVVWTDAYVDPAGGGWMVSAIAPVYGPRKLEAVVGIDVTVDTIIKRVLATNLPWNGYALLVGRDGSILALPPAGERDLGLKELKNHSYDYAIQADTFKPEQFRISRRDDLKPLAAAIASNRPQITQLNLNGRIMLATNAPVHGPGWSLVILAPAESILADATSLRDRLHRVGEAMIISLILFYTGFMLFLSVRAEAMSRRVAAPLQEIEAVMDRIGAGEYDQQAPRSGVTELDAVASHLVEMGSKLGDAHHKLVAQEEEVRRALDSEKVITTGQRRFIRMLSHEFRTPLSVIDSCGQILRRRAARLTEQAAIERSEMIGRATSRMDHVLKSALQLMQLEEGAITLKPATISLDRLIRDAVSAGQPEQASGAAPIEIAISPIDNTAALTLDPALVGGALSAIIENACKFSKPGGRIEIATTVDEKLCTIIIRDHGVGIDPTDLPHVCERFYRGANSTAIPGVGTGLHLASTLIVAHQGKLAIQSEPGTGTTVTVTLPVRTPIANPLSEAA